MKERVKVAIIGCGPYGISIANELYSRGIDFVIFGKPFSLWFEHTQDNMAIRSDWHTSEIYSPDNKYSFWRYLEESRPEEVDRVLKERIPVDIFRSYLSNVLKRLPYTIEKTYVIRLEKRDHGFNLECENGSSIVAEHVIIATGIESHKYLPSILAGLDSERVIHAWDVKRFQGLSGKRILLIGAGQSAAEAIGVLAKSNTITWLLRHKPIFFNEPINLPTPVFNFVLKISPVFFFIPVQIKKILAKKFVESTITPDLKNVVNNKNVEQLTGNINDLGLSTVSGGVRSAVLNRNFDLIIAATGYRYSIESIPFLSREIRQSLESVNGIPRLTFRFETSVPNLYMVGGIAEPSHGPALRFIMGTYHAAKGIRAIARRFAV